METAEVAPDAAALLNRIQERLRALGKSERGAAEEAGLSGAAIRQIREGKSRSPRLDTIRKLAPVLETSVEWLAFGREPEATFGTVRSEATLRERPVVAIPKVGFVEAGAFRTVNHYDDDFESREKIFDEPDPEFPNARLVAFEVAGDSMNAAEPPIWPGSNLICVDFDDAGIPLSEGMTVVVEQTLEGGHVREWSVKEVELYPDRIEYHPRSANPIHKPIIVPINAEPEDGREVRVLALVRRVSLSVPKSRVRRR